MNLSKPLKIIIVLKDIIASLKLGKGDKYICNFSFHKNCDCPFFLYCSFRRNSDSLVELTELVHKGEKKGLFQDKMPVDIQRVSRGSNTLICQNLPRKEVRFDFSTQITQKFLHRLYSNSINFALIYMFLHSCKPGLSLIVDFRQLLCLRVYLLVKVKCYKTLIRNKMKSFSYLSIPQRTLAYGRNSHGRVRRLWQLCRLHTFVCL